MNKIIKYVLVFVITIGFLTGGSFAYRYVVDHYSRISNDVSIEVNTIEDMRKIIANEEIVYVYMGRPNCGDSDDFEIYFEKYLQDAPVDFVFFNIIDIYKKHSLENKYKDILTAEFGMKATPTIAIFENGELIALSEWTPEGGYSEEMFEEFMKEHDLL